MAEPLDCDVTGRYRRRYRVQDFVFGAANFLSSIFSQKRTPLLHPPRRILICNMGAIGDVLLTTALFKPLKLAYPGVSIGFLTTKDASSALSREASVCNVHMVEHWSAALRKNCSASSIFKILKQNFQLAKEVRGEKYDLAIDVRMWFPSSVLFLYFARIPIRIGFTRLGFSGLLTHPVGFTYDRRHETEHQLDLLRAIGISADLLKEARPEIAPASQTHRDKIKTVINVADRFRILHPGSSSSIKDWNVTEWRELAKNLLARGITPVITGRGARDHALADSIVVGLTGAVNLCDLLSWDDLVALIQRADAVYSVDTSIGHLAAALNKPVISIFGGMSDPSRWAPLNAAVATNTVPCSPCLNKFGCATRDCLTGLPASEVERVALTTFGL